MADYRNPGPDEPRQRVPEGYWPDYLLSLAIVWSGVNNRLPPDKLPNGLVADAQNCRMRNGDIEPRKGVVKPGWLNQTSGLHVLPAGSALYGAGVFSDPATREWTIIAADGYVWACCPGNARQAIAVPQGVSVRMPVTFCQAFNQLYLFRGRYLRPLVLKNWTNGFVDIEPQYSSTGGSSGNGTYRAAIQPISQLADEMAYGPFVSVTSMTLAGTVVTVVTAQPHGFVNGSDVVVMGVTQAGYNARWAVTVVDNYTFTFPVTGSVVTTYGAPTGGSIKVSNMMNFWSALGDRLTLVAGALTSTSTTATVAYTAHGLSVGQWIKVSGADQAGYDGTFQVQTVADGNHFTYTVVAGLTTPATGTIYIFKPTVTAGHTPDTNPEAWQQIYDVLPNADDAIYVNGRMLVPTAYTPGDTAYDSTSSWTKKDYLVAMDVFDGVHFQFTNAFRINQGDDSEITGQVKYDNTTVLVFKGKRWGILSNLQGTDYSAITFDLHAGEYGCVAQRAAVAAGKDVYFASALRGLTGLNQTQQGIVQGVDIPVSNDIPQWLARINWNQAAAQRVTWWNDCIYWAVALDSSATNNAVLVYDLRLHQWASRDTGLSVQEFFKTTIGGLERLCFLGTDGWVNVVEEATAGDMVADATQPGNVGWAEIPTDVTLKGHLFGQPGQKDFPLVELGVAVWNASFTVTVTSGGVRSVRATTLANKTFSRTKYLKPFNAQPWNPLNPNGDYANPNRGDYSVLLAENMNLAGCSTLQWQEVFLRPSTAHFRASYALIRVTNTTGRLKIKAVTPASQSGERRIGIAI